MKTVSRFEADLLHLLHFFLHRLPSSQGLPLLKKTQQAPPWLSWDAVSVVKDTLAKGCVLLLARRGGWRRQRHLREGRASDGRVWERTPPAELALTFSVQSLSFLMWAAAEDVTGKKAAWAAPTGQPSSGDALLFFLAYEAMRRLRLSPELRAQPFAQNALCRLAYPEDLLEYKETAPNFGPWTEGIGACILEALQPFLAGRWVEVEVSKRDIVREPTIRALGQSQERVLDSFLTAAAAAGRRDLARFLLEVAARLLTEQATTADWLGGVPLQGRLADTAQTMRAAMAFVRQLGRLQEWEREARGVGYFDEDYAASQLWKADWERFGGDVLGARATALLRQEDSLKLQQEGTRS